MIFASADQALSAHLASPNFSHTASKQHPVNPVEPRQPARLAGKLLEIFFNRRPQEWISFNTVE